MTLSPYDYGFWMLGFLLEVYVVVCTIARKSFLRYLPLNLFMLGMAASEILQYLFAHKYGLTSIQYMYFYYYSDSVMTVFLYFVVMGFYKQVFEEMKVSKHLSTATLFELDEVIDPAETRKWVMAGLRAMPPVQRSVGKKRAWIDTW